MTAVHQLLPVFARHDAIGGAVRETQAMLRDMGFRSEVFADVFDRSLEARPAGLLSQEVDPGDVVIYHLSIGSDLARHFARLPCRRVVVYHNITPPEYFDPINPAVAYRLRQGRDDLALVVPRADLCIADSTFNAEEMRPFGPHATAVIPPPVDLKRLPRLAPSPPSSPQLLFVGRIAPNKRHDSLLKVLAAMHAAGSPDARLVLAGGSHDTSAYTAALHHLARRLGIADSVTFLTEHVSNDALASLYATSSAFVCASDHEGFCMPVVEAMAFSLPVIAHRAGALAETVGDAGIILDDHDPLVWAEAVARVMTPGPVREELVRRGHARVADFSHARIRSMLEAALADLGVTP